MFRPGVRSIFASPRATPAIPCLRTDSAAAASPACLAMRIFDISFAARVYATVMGVLAGFTFSVVVQIISRDESVGGLATSEGSSAVRTVESEADRVRRQLAADVLKVFLLGFIACIAAAFVYGTLSGDHSPDRIELANFFGAAIAVNAFLLIAFGLTLLVKLRATGVLFAVAFAGRTIVPVVATVIMTVSVLFFAGHHPGSGHFDTLRLSTFLVLFAVTLALLLGVPRLATSISRLLGLVRANRDTQQNDVTRYLITIAACLLLVCGLATAVVDELSPTVAPPVSVILPLQGGAMAVVFMYAVAIYAMSPPPRKLVVPVDNPIWLAGETPGGIRGLLRREARATVSWSQWLTGAPRWKVKVLSPAATEAAHRYEIGRWRKTTIRVFEPLEVDGTDLAPSLLVTIALGRATRVRLRSRGATEAYGDLSAWLVDKLRSPRLWSQPTRESQELRARVKEVLELDDLAGWEVRSLLQWEADLSFWKAGRVWRETLCDISRDVRFGVWLGGQQLSGDEVKTLPARRLASLRVGARR